MVRRLGQFAAAGGALAIGVLGMANVAGAATDYPPTTITTTASTPTNVTGGTTVVDLGNEPVGITFTTTLCGFSPGTAVSVSVNDTVDAGGSAGAGGCVTLTAVVSDPHVAVNGGAPVAVSLGANDLTANGTSAGGGVQTDTAEFNVVTSTAAAAASSGLAFTGADIMAMTIGGLALVALGFLVVTFARRRVRVTSI